MLRLLAIALAAVAVAAGPFSAETDGDVLVLTDATFDAAIEEHALVLVEFYAPWCGHCKKLQPEWDSAAKTLKESAPEVRLAKVDATENRDTGSKFDVQGFPTIKLFNNGAAAEYKGGREAADIVAYMVKKSGPAAATVATAEDKDKLMSGEGDVSVLGYFKDLESKQAKAFLAAASAESMDGFAFGITADASLVGTDGESVVLYKPFDEGKNELAVTAATEAAEVEAFVGKFALRLVTVFSPETQGAIFGGAVKTHLLTFVKQGADHYAPTLATLEESAAAHRGEVLHVAVPSSETRIMEYFGFDEDVLPKVVLADMRNNGMKKYMFEGAAITTDAIVQFEADFFAKKLKPSLKSEEPSKADDAEDVIVLKGKTFEAKVIDSKASVFVEFYAPWCGHCKSLAPKWEALAEQYNDNSDVVIAKMDATANEIDVEGVDVEGFPTLIWFPAGAKGKPEQYGGARELDALAKFVEENIGGKAKASSDEL